MSPWVRKWNSLCAFSPRLFSSFSAPQTCISDGIQNKINKYLRGLFQCCGRGIIQPNYLLFFNLGFAFVCADVRVRLRTRGGTGLMRQCQRVKTSVCTCAMSKQRHSVHGAFGGKCDVPERQPPFSWSTSMFYLSGVAKQAVCLTQQQLQQQQKSQRAAFFSFFFSLGLRWAGNFCLRDNVVENVCPVIHFPE